MATLFTRILQGELPGRFVWRDERCAAFLTIAPIRPGHLLVVPLEETDHWLDLEPDLAAHLTEVARTLGRALQHAFPCRKVGLMIAGLEVPHVHLHVLPIDRLEDMDFANQDQGARAEDLDAAARKVRDSLVALGLDARARAIS